MDNARILTGNPEFHLSDTRSSINWECSTHRNFPQDKCLWKCQMMAIANENEILGNFQRYRNLLAQVYTFKLSNTQYHVCKILDTQSSDSHLRKEAR